MADDTNPLPQTPYDLAAHRRRKNWIMLALLLGLILALYGLSFVKFGQAVYS